MDKYNPTESTSQPQKIPPLSAQSSPSYPVGFPLPSYPGKRERESGSTLGQLLQEIGARPEDFPRGFPLDPSVSSLLGSLGISGKGSYIRSLRDDFPVEIFFALQRRGVYLKRTERFFRCGKFFTVKRCDDCGKEFSVIASYCDERFICEICAKKRRLPRLKKKYLPLIRALMQRPKGRARLVMITVTEVGDGLIPGAARIKAHNKAIRKLMREFCPKTKGYGGFAVNHFQGENGTHLNSHILAWAPYLDRDMLSRWWEKERGAWNVDIREVREGTWEVANHLLSYVARGATLPEGDELERFGVMLALHETTKGVRLIHTFGIFYNAQARYLTERVNPRCPYCGSENTRDVLVMCSLAECRERGAPYIGEVIRAGRSPPQLNLFKEGN